MMKKISSLFLSLMAGFGVSLGGQASAQDTGFDREFSKFDKDFERLNSWKTETPASKKLKRAPASVAAPPAPPGVAGSTVPLNDDVPDAVKWERFRRLEELQENIAAEIHARYLGGTTEVLFEEKVKHRWKGRTPTNKLVFVESADDLRGRVLPVQITWTGPWSMQGRVVEPVLAER